MAKKKFPKTMYVRRENDGDNDFFVAEYDLEFHAEIGEKVPVAIYDLVSVETVTAKVEISTE